jgi:serine/threonine-protein kinase RsbW
VSHACRIICELEATLPATLDAIEEFSIEFRRHADLTLAPTCCFAAELLVREALTNAVKHGCHGDPDKSVRCRVRLKRQHLTIRVDDGGEGFDWRAAWGRPSKVSATSGRGIEIIRKYATRVQFNERGNALTIVKKFSTKE